MSIDVTDFVRDHPDQQITFMIAREVRFDGENVDDALTSLEPGIQRTRHQSRPATVPDARRSFALPGDYDHNGTSTWQRLHRLATELRQYQL